MRTNASILLEARTNAGELAARTVVAIRAAGGNVTPAQASKAIGAVVDRAGEDALARAGRRP